MPDRPPRLRVGKPRETPRVWVEPADERGSAHSRGYGVAWRRLREVVLQAEPLCRHCMERGRLTPAVEVDHIRPLRDGGTNDRENLQCLCREHHMEKTIRDTKARKHGGPREMTRNGRDHIGPLSARGSRIDRGEAL